MVDLSVMFWLFVGGPIIAFGGIAALAMWINDIRYRREMRAVMDEHRGWR